MPSLLFFVTEDWYFCSHRLELARAARKCGFTVTVLTRVRDHGEQIRAAGLNLIPLEVSRQGIAPLAEIRTIWRLLRIFRSERPDIVHSVSMKPILYGALAARGAGIKKTVNTLPGLGFIFTSSRLKAKALQPLMRQAFRVFLNEPQCRVITQNPENLQTLAAGVVDHANLVLIRGSGVDMSVFAPQPEPAGPPLVILASRMLWDKGVADFVAAAGRLKRAGVAARFALVGDTDIEHHAAVPVSQLRSWHDDGTVEWWGQRRDMPAVFAQSHIVCLPTTYGEGVPKVLIEAAAAGRPIVATDAPGCREIVRHQENGLLIPPRDPRALAAGLRQLIESPSRRHQMGKCGRELALRDFSIQQVVSETLAVYQELVD